MIVHHTEAEVEDRLKTEVEVEDQLKTEAEVEDQLKTEKQIRCNWASSQPASPSPYQTVHHSETNAPSAHLFPPPGFAILCNLYAAAIFVIGGLLDPFTGAQFRFWVCDLELLYPGCLTRRQKVCAVLVGFLQMGIGKTVSTIALILKERRVVDPSLVVNSKVYRNQIILDDPVSYGRSIALVMLVHWARNEGWLILYVPSGRYWTHDGLFYKNPETGLWDTPLQAVNILQDFLRYNKSCLQSLKCKILDPIPLGKGVGVRWPKGRDKMQISEEMTLSQLFEAGISDTHAATARLRKELSEVTSVPVLIAIDQEPVTPRSCRPVHAKELTTVSCDVFTHITSNISNQIFFLFCDFHLGFDAPPREIEKSPGCVRTIAWLHSNQTILGSCSNMGGVSFGLVKKYGMPCIVESASLEPKCGNKFTAGGEDMWVHVLDFHT
ncbi:hypothetical protein ACS0TY_012944 [Phlomoides rotata]